MAERLMMTLDTDGWVETPVRIADRMLSNFLLAEQSQTFFFPHDVYSFPYLIGRYGSDLIELRQQVQENLARYYGTRFSQVETEVRTEIVEDSVNRAEMFIYLTFTDNEGLTHNLSKIVRYSGQKVSKVLDILNT